MDQTQDGAIISPRGRPVFRVILTLLPDRKCSVTGIQHGSKIVVKVGTLPLLAQVIGKNDPKTAYAKVKTLA